jgi:hypothetical protein
MTRGKILFILVTLLILGFGVVLFGPPRSVSEDSSPVAVSSSPVSISVVTPSETRRTGTEATVEAQIPVESPRSAPALSPSDQKKFLVLREILDSKNDNDPRIDTELKGLSSGLKRALVASYLDQPKEKLNERGTIVFLIGREIASPPDVDFLKGVLLEKPCMSISDCSRAPAPHAGEDDHREMVNDTTIRYPQLMAIQALKDRFQALKEAPKGQEELLRQIRSALEEATRSPDPRIAEEAKAALSGS